MIYDEKRGFAKAEPLFCIDLSSDGRSILSDNR